MIDSILRTTIGGYVERGELAGAAMLVWRQGLALVTCVGHRDLDGPFPVERDTIFRIASLSKPITSVLALMLRDEGRFELDDPIARWAPEFGHMQVLLSPEGPLDAVEPAGRSITVTDLLSHRAGLTYGDFHSGPIAKAYRGALGADIDSEVVPSDWITRLSALPLIDQPGRAFHYGKSTDLLGLLIERIEDAPLADILQRRIFGPLGMKDTGFEVPPHKRHRCAALLGFDAGGRPANLTAPPGGHALAVRPEDMAFVSGGQGLWSTLEDYLAFARLFVEGGTSEGERLLRPETIKLMATNCLTDHQRANSRLFGQPLFAQGHGFGLGVAVVMEPDKADPVRCGGGAGSVGWPGAYGGWWQADLNDGSVMIFLAHSMASLEQLMDGIGIGVWSAIREFQMIGSAVE